jgi:hypothetical protein
MTLPLPPNRVRRALAEFRTRRFAGLGLVPVLLSSLAWAPVPVKAASVVAPAASQSGCGSGPSWATKIGTDSQARQVDQASPAVRTTVAQLTRLPLPSSIQHRVRPTETTIYTITATLNDITIEHDRDSHLAVNDGSGHFMITEVPDPGCVPSSSAFYSSIVRAHSQLAAWSGRMPATVQITGVGFFDNYTGQSDQAPNQIELHPVLNINFNPGSSPGSIAGRLTSSAGGAISGAQVSDSGGTSIRTDGSGNYTLSGLAAGQHTVTAAASGFVSQNKSVTVTSGNTTTANFVLTPSQTTGGVAGTVTNSSDGTDIAGVAVDDDVGDSARTNTSGAYAISGLSPGRHTLTTAMSGFAPQSKTVTITSGQNATADFALTASQTTGTATGTVTSAAGAVIVGAVVSDNTGASGTTNGSGVYSLAGLAAGSHTLTVAASGFVSQSRSVTVTAGSTTTADFVLAPSQNTGSATGTVTSASDGSVVTGAVVSDGGGARATTDGSGVYTINGLVPGSHSLTAAAGGFVPQTKSVNVTAGTASSADFVLAPVSQSGAAQLVQAAGVNENSASTSLSGAFSAPTSAGHLLVLSASVYTGVSNPITAVTDSGGNTWTRIGAFGVAGHYSDGEMWYAAAARSVTSVTIQTASAAIASLEVQEFSGVATTSPLDVSAGTSNVSTSPGSGSVTPTAANELVVGFIAGHSLAQAISVTAPGYTDQAQQTSNGGGLTITGLVSGYQVLSSPSAQSFTGSLASPMYWAAGIATFKAGP